MMLDKFVFSLEVGKSEFTYLNAFTILSGIGPFSALEL